MGEKGVHPYVTYLKNHYYSYGRFQEEEGLPSLKGFHVEDVSSLNLAPWDRKGGRGTFINLSEQEVDDAYVCEIAPGASLKPQRHLYEEVIYVVEGRGATSLWNPGQEPLSFEWKEGSLFAIPLNACHQHFNGDGTRRALLLGVTSAPVMMNLYHNREFIFNCPHVFSDRFEGAPDEFRRDAKWMEEVTLWETNFIADVRDVGMTAWEERGRDLKGAFIALAANVMKIHIAEFAVGTYKKAHRHGPGAHILILNGTGYSLMWPPGTEPRRFNWRVGSLISPPAGWFHQHFNTGPGPVFHLAFHRPASIYNKNERGEIEYEDEDPEIRGMYEAELARNGVQIQMPPIKGN
ncbi:MAG: cupin domain-containing protein [Firmicutes bacterium]|nr:cupin domain-containing protein [Bacillota bacterium]